MKGMFYFLIIFCMASAASAEVSTRICLADANTPVELADPNVPFIYRDIMVGTRLTIIVDSNAGGLWGGDLVIEGEYMDYGLLSARDYNDITIDWEGSHLEAAGSRAYVSEWAEAGMHGFILEGSDNSVPGDWFVIDYTATNIGICEVGFYDRDVSWDYPVYYHVFSHVPTRDFNSDTIVDFADFAVLGSHWQETGCNDPNWCEGTDINIDGNVDLDDLILFSHYWLEKTE